MYTVVQFQKLVSSWKNQFLSKKKYAKSIYWNIKKIFFILVNFQACNLLIEKLTLKTTT